MHWERLRRRGIFVLLMASIGIVIILIVAAILAVTLAFAWRHRQPTASKDPLAHMKELIKGGIIYEDEFVDVYYRVIRDEGFMMSFGQYQEEARKLLSTMIEESKGHKNLLENIMANIK